MISPWNDGITQPGMEYFSIEYHWLCLPELRRIVRFVYVEGSFK